MLKLYKEHPEFDEFTKFDTETGKLVAITEEEFKLFLPEDFLSLNWSYSRSKRLECSSWLLPRSM